MKKRVVLEIVICLFVPLIIWNFARKEFGDFYAMLLTTLPGFIYGIAMFFSKKQFNVSGAFIISTLLIWRTLDIISGSAQGMLWNGVYINLAYVLFWIITIILKKPMGMYFLKDFANLRGYPKEILNKILVDKSTLRHAKNFTWFLIIKDLEGAILRALLIIKFGVGGFSKIIIYMTINGYVFVGIGLVLALLIEKKIRKPYGF